MVSMIGFTDFLNQSPLGVSSAMSILILNLLIWIQWRINIRQPVTKGTSIKVYSLKLRDGFHFSDVHKGVNTMCYFQSK